MRLLDGPSGRVLLRDLAIARSFRARLQGLLGRASISTDEGLFFPGTTSLHMLGMRFPIAVIWLSHADPSGSRAVLGVEVLAPWRGLAFAPSGVDGALEAHPDLATALRVGDQVRIAE